VCTVRVFKASKLKEQVTALSHSIRNLAVGFSTESIPALHPITELRPSGTALLKGIETYTAGRNFCVEKFIFCNINSNPLSISALDIFRIKKVILYCYILGFPGNATMKTNVST
jgi:hypothetical protein